MLRDKRLKDKKGYFTFAAIGILFIFCWITEQKLAQDGNILWTFGWTARLMIVSLALGVILGSLLYAGLTILEICMDRRRASETGKASGVFRGQGSRRFDNRSFFFVTWLCVFVCWVPAFLAYYPAICAYDAVTQIGQILENSYNSHHPIFHTLLIRAALNFGDMCGDRSFGIAVYALVQMAFLSAMMAGANTAVRIRHPKKIWSVLLLVWSCLFPFHMYMAVSVVKDTVFSAFFLATAILLLLLLLKKENSFKPGIADVGYVVCLVGMILFRNNGKYALLVLAATLFLAVLISRKFRKHYARILFQTVGALLIGSLLLQGVFVLTDAEQADKREMLSVPIQQLARTMVYHGGVGADETDDGTMSEEDRALIDDFILYQAYLNYRPDISDPVKNNTNTYVVRYRTVEFLTTYFRLMLQYPGDYVNAFLALNAGYLYPEDTTHAHINENGVRSGLGYIQTQWPSETLDAQQISRDFKWEWMFDRLEDFANNNAYLDIPVLKYLMVPGTYLWYCLILAAWAFTRKRYSLLIVLSMIFGYYLTLFLGPAVQMRYLYPVMITAPYLICVASAGDQRNSVEMHHENI